jgi:hypothetical protein
VNTREQKSRKAEEHREAATGSTAVAQAQSGAVTAGAIDYSADAGAGQEGADKDSYAIPFLIVLQPLSPVVVDETIPGAKAGMILNSVTNELFNELFLIPCAFQRRWIRWGAREAGGGFKGEFTTPQAKDIQARGEVKELEGRLYYPEQDGSINPKKSDRLSDTRSHYVLGLRDIKEPGFSFPALLALTSTGIKVSKNWMSRMEGIRLRKGGKPDGELYNPPSFSHVYRLTSIKEQNEKGTWFLPVINMVGPVEHPDLYRSAKAFHEQILSGAVTVAHETASKGDGGGDAGKGF